MPDYGRGKRDYRPLATDHGSDRGQRIRFGSGYSRRIVSESTIQLLHAFRLGNTFSSVSKAEILEQLPKLNPIELREIRERIWQLEEDELLSGRAQPSDEEKALLDREFEDFERDPASGSSWQEVKSRLKK